MALRQVVADSSSIILLQKVRLLGPLLHNYRVIIPPHVYEELTGYGKKGSNELGDLLTENIVQTTDGIPIEGLDQGESSVITLFSGGVGDFVLLDDRKAAYYCKSRAIPFINALLVSRILFLAGVIKEDNYRVAAAQLIQEGYYSDMIIRKAAAIEDAELQQFMPQ